MTQNTYSTWRNVMLDTDSIEMVSKKIESKNTNDTWLLSSRSINESEIQSFQAGVWALSFLSEMEI